MNNFIAYADTGAKNIACPGTGNLKSLTDIINYFTCTLLDVVVPLFFALAVVGFIWGIIKYFLNPDSEEKKNQGKTFMIWGLITLFVMVTMWGIVQIFSTSFGLETVLPGLPQ